MRTSDVRAAASVTRSPRGVPLRRRVQIARHHGIGTEARLVIGLGVIAVLTTALVVREPTGMPVVSLMIPMLVASLFLGPRSLPWFVIVMLLLLTYALSTFERGQITAPVIGGTVVMFVMGLIVLLTSFQRSRLGVGGLQGESMLVDLRDRILTQARIPGLPPGWHVDSALHSAGGTPFAGDFVVATRVPGPDRLEMVVVDVSGKGADAGTRALLLSGAFGGLLGALRPAEFLPAANDFLLRQDWDEGFATAVHLSLDLDSGAYELRAAGHPPALHRIAGSGRWEVVASQGPVLGLIEGADFHASRGVLGRGDAVLLYTDGMVEEPRRDIELGIDRLLGKSEQLLQGGFHEVAARLAAQLGSPDDDRAMIVVHRS